MAGKLFIVPTPVGNLDDMTFRAVQVLKEADLILAEDTRTSSVLLHHYDIRRPLQSHHKFNEHQTVQLVKERILGGLNVALVSDAGTPGISDPGFLLARTCAEEGIEVQTLPGATACIPAIVSSGLPHRPRGGNPHHGLLRVPLPAREDAGTIRRAFRAGAPLLRRPGNLQAPRGAQTRHPPGSRRLVPGA